jgi:hypothetical protein
MRKTYVDVSSKGDSPEAHARVPVHNLKNWDFPPNFHPLPGSTCWAIEMGERPRYVIVAQERTELLAGFEGTFFNEVVVQRLCMY